MTFFDEVKRYTQDYEYHLEESEEGLLDAD